MRPTVRTLSLLLAILFPTGFALAENATWQDLRTLVEKAPPVGAATAAPTLTGSPVIVTFFASWCPPCTDEFRHLNELARSDELGDAKILGINLFEDFGGKKNPQRMVRFLKDTDPQFPLVSGSEKIAKAFGEIDRIPTIIVYGKSGREVWRFIHIRDAKKTHATMEDLVEALALARDG